MKKLFSYSWLTASEYGETDALTSNKDRYTEKMTSFTRNGGIKALQRYGKQSSGTSGYELVADATSSFDEELDLMDAVSPDANIPQAQMGINIIEYHGPVIYRNGTIDMVLFPGGYATINGTAVTFHYYTQDYLGNNRAVINGSTGAIEQTIAYYPFGAVIADLGTPSTGQPYKFGGKELLSANGLNEYDFGARNYYPAVPGFTKPDPLGEKYPWLSPFLYCANNPVNAFDPDGNLIIFLNGMHKGDGGKPEYWNGVDDDIKNILNDYNAKYIDGSYGEILNTIVGLNTFLSGRDCTNISAENRIAFGYFQGLAQAKEIYKLAQHETIVIITHSMGAAAAKGFVKALIEYANKHGFDPRILLELDIAPFEWWDQKGNPDVPTYTISHWFDVVAGPSFMKNAKNFRSHLKVKDINPFDEHSIESFRDDAVDALDGIIKGMKSGEIKVYLDGKRMY